jgi:titin
MHKTKGTELKLNRLIGCFHGLLFGITLVPAIVQAQLPAPEPLEITRVTANTIGLAWNDIYDDEDGFRLSRSDNFGNTTTFYFGANVTNYLDTNLVTGITYYYQIVAFNSGGDSDPAYNSATPTPIPGPEPLLITGVTANTVGLTWNDIYDDEDGFRLSRSDNFGNTSTFYFGANVTNYLDTNLVTGVTYNYQIVAFNSGGDSAPAYNYATPTPIAGPAPLLITGVTANTVGLTWNDIYNNEDGFRLSRSDNFGNTSTFYFGANVTNYLDTNLVTGVTYNYQIVAFNSGGDSAPAYNFATPTPIPGPAPLLITGVTANTVGLTWNDIYNNEDGFRLSRSDNFGNTSTFYFGANVTNYLDTNLVTGVTYNYQIVAFNSGGDSAPAYNFATPTPIAGPAPLLITGVTANTVSLTWNDIYNNEDGFRLSRSDSFGNTSTFYFGANVTNYLDTNLVTGVTYNYQIVAFNSGGDSAPAYNYATPTPIPGPEPLLIAGVTANTVSLTWNDIYSNEDGFRLSRSDNFGNTSTFYFGANVTNYLDTNLVTGVTYNYQIVAFNSGGDSAPAYNYATPTPIPGPGPLVATNVTATSVDLFWNDIYSNEDGFRIERQGEFIDPGFTTIAILGPNVTSFHDTGLLPGTEYFYHVFAFNSGGDSAYAATTVNTVPPVPFPPSDLSAAALSQTQIVLNWTPGSGNATGFQIASSTNGVDFFPLATVDASVTSYTNSGLSPATLYYYDVTAFNDNGYSLPSDPTNATTLDYPPSAPSALSAAPVSASRIDLAWTDNSGNETGFKIYISTNGVSFTLLANVGANVTAYSSTGLSPVTTYYFQVTAFNSGGQSSASAAASATTLPIPPAAPSGLSATAVSQTQINLSWTDNSSTETGFRIERSLDGMIFTVLTTVAANTTSYTDSGLHSFTTYYYRVSAFNAGGSSPTLNVASAKTTDYIPDAPSGLTATALSAWAIKVTWNDNSTNEIDFRLYSSTDGTNFTPTAVLSANVTTFTYSNLVQGYTLYFQVRARNSAGFSPYSNLASATTLNNPPAAPSGLIATTVSSNLINLSWTDNAANETGYKILRSTDGTNFIFIATLGSNVTSYASSGLTSSTLYYYQVVSYNDGGYSTAATASATTAGINPPAAPSGLSATAVSTSRIDLSWTDNSGNETGFKIYLSTNGTAFTLLANVASNVTAYSSTGLSTAATYYYRVSAFNSSGGESIPSSTAVASTLPNPPAAPSGLSATTVSQTQISLNWSDNSTNETGFRIYISADGTNFTTLTNVAANVTACSSAGLSAGTTYYYKVTALNTGGESPASGIASATTLPNPPPAPSALSATAISQYEIRLIWFYNYTNQVSFKIERSLDGVNFSVVTTTPYPEYDDTGLNPETIYYYRVSAVNSSGQSAPTSIVHAGTLQNPPVAPSGLVATTISQTQINLGWTDNSSDENQFNIERSLDGVNFSVLAIAPANTTSFADTNLNPATTYYYRVSAVNFGGQSWSPVASAATLPNPPAAPSGPVATAISQTQIDLSWTDNSANETGFQIERSLDGVNFSVVTNVAANVTSYADNGLNPLTAYYYRVIAFNTGGSSAASSVASATTPDYAPAAPSGLLALAASQTEIDLTWTDNANNETGSRIYISTDGTNFTVLTNVAASVTAYFNVGLNPATTYYYKVTAFNSGGESAPTSIASTSTLPIPPAAPSGLTATANSQTQITLNWSDNSTNETGFRIELSYDGVNFALRTQVAAGVTSYVDGPLNPASTYYYRVIAFNTGGSSAASSVAGATTLPNPPAAPSGLGATANSQTQITLNWSDNSANETGFRIERSLDGVNFSLLTNTAANVTSYADTGLNPVTTYYYRVFAFNTGGSSLATFIVSATTPDFIPAAPSALSATAISATQINLAWTDNANNETGFNIYRSTDGINFSLLTNVAANVTSYSNTGLVPATTYYYRVTASNATGESAASNMASATTLAVPPAAPSALTATAVSSNRVDLSWTDNAGNETGFLIERSPDGINFTQIATVGANVTTYSNTGLTASTTYYYRVRATNSAGNSAYSNTANATTGPSAPPAAPSNLTLTVISGSQINLQWNDNSSNETQFLIERSLNGTTFTQIATVGANVKNYSATGLTANTRYYFRVRAANSLGNSAYSNTANAKTLMH